jgi:hypothetical protein
MKKKTIAIIGIIIGIILLYVGLWLITDNRDECSKPDTLCSFAGYFRYGSITLWPAKAHASILPAGSPYVKSRWFFDHEYGHWIYNYAFIKGDLLKWKLAVDKCGWQGFNYKEVTAKGLKYQEEFSDNVAQYNYGDLLCSEKIEIIQRYVTNSHT